jgi:hypothetical protein
MMFDKKTTALTRAAGLALLGAAASANAQALVGSGTNLPIPTINPGQPAYQIRALSSVVHPTSFDGTWTAPAQTPWLGTFNAFGPVPNSANSGSTRYDFTTLNAGYLPTGTYFNFGDVDGGSTLNETFILTAFDISGNIISGAWLNQPVGVWGSGNGTAGVPITTDMPSWSLASGQYTIAGSGVSGPNPSIAFALTSNTDVYSMELIKISTHYSFSLAAPLVPAPGSLALLGTAGLVAVRRRRS